MSDPRLPAKDRFWRMVLKKSVSDRSRRWSERRSWLCGRHLDRHRDELGELAEVLCRGGEVELVASAVRTA